MPGHPKFMLEAIRLATENIKNNGGPFGAVVVKDGIIIGKGANRVTDSMDPTAHAEVVAIRMACQNINSFSLAGADLYTSCEPCPMCLSAIYWSRLDRVYFGNSREDAARVGFDDAYIYEQVALDSRDRALEMKNICSDHAIKSFIEWTQTSDKTEY